MVILGGAGASPASSLGAIVDQRLARGAARPEPARAGSSTAILHRAHAREAAAVDEARRGPRRRRSLRLRGARDRRRRLAERRRRASAGGRRRASAVRSHWVVLPAHDATCRQLRVRRARRHACSSLTLLHGWRASCCSSRRSTSRAFVWENRLVDEPSVTRLHPPRRDADRADERAARRGCSARPGWRSYDRPLLELRGVTKAFGGLHGDRRARPRRRRGRDRQRDRAERRRQDDALQPHHRRLPAGRGRDPARRARASSACRRTRSRSSGSRARSRRCGCS